MKNNVRTQQGASNMVMIGIVAVIVLGGIAYFATSNMASESTDVANGEVMEKEDGEVMEKEDGEVMEKEDGEVMEKEDGEVMEKAGEVMIKAGEVMAMVKGVAGAEVTSLEAVGEYTGSGSAQRLIKGDELLHFVVADLGDPQPGTQYEGWLVQASPLKFFSTGLLQKDAGGTWSLEYMSDQPYASYSKVVITEETVIDATPEAHVLEGDF